MIPHGGLPSDSGCATGGDHLCQTLRDVYAQHKFAGLDRDSADDNFLSAIDRAVSRFIDWLGHLLGTGGSIALVGLLLAAVTLLVAWRLRSMTAARVTGTFVEELAVSDDPDGEWRHAEAAARRGDFREAIRHAFRSALLDAVRRGRIRFDASWTTREMLAVARNDAALVTALTPAAASFDEAWYSGHAVAAVEWERARDHCATVRRLAHSRDAAVAA